MFRHNMHFLAGPAQCQAPGEHCIIVLTAHFGSMQTEPRASASPRAAEGMFVVEFSMLTFKIM